jgi:hypothetical protein
VTRSRGYLLVVVGVALFVVSAVFGGREMLRWQRWPKVEATVVDYVDEEGRRGTQSFAVVEYAAPGSGAKVTAKVRAGESDRVFALGARMALAVNPEEPEQNTSAKAAWILLLGPLAIGALAGVLGAFILRRTSTARAPDEAQGIV